MERANFAPAQGTDEADRGYRPTNYSSGLLLVAIASVLVSCGGGASESGPGGGSVAITCVAGPGPGATLNWDPVAGAAGYNVYSRTASGNFALLQNVVGGNMTTLTVNGLASGTTYYFAATAYDSSNNESGFSNVACKSVS
jgi:hypothetical protein